MRWTLCILFLLLVHIEISGQTLPSDNIYGGSDNGLVGKTGDEFEVTPNGQFRCDIPIAAVPGTGGMTPQLSISYNSSNGDGLLGYGFDLTGLSMISRSPENLYRDGDADVIRFDSSDRFALDGMRLSPVKVTSTYREYKTETNNFAKIISEGDIVNPSKFTVYTKDGLIREYTSAKILMGAAGDKNLYWLETKVSDTKGNYYTITYNGDVGNNGYRPVRIDYTGNSTASLVPFASIRFTYLLVDRSPAYISGEKSRRNYAIKDITCYYGNQQVRKYEIMYTSVNGRLFMDNISEITRNGKKNPTSFSWKNRGDFNVENSVSSSDADFKNPQMITGDFNGDGKADFLTRVNNDKKNLNYKIYISNGNTFGSPISGQFILPENAHPNYNRINEVRSGDFNGDGYDDIVVERASIPFYAIDLYLSHANSGGSVSIRYEKTIIPVIQFEHTMIVTDANCDGAADLFVRNKNYASSTYYMLMSKSTESGVSPLEQQYESELSGDSWYGNVLLADFDGDGTSEVLNIHEKDYSVLYLMQPSGELKREKALSLSGTDYFSVGDFNGDGKTDIMTTGSVKDESIGWEINFSTGLVGTDMKTFDYTSVTKLFSPKDKQPYVVDINGDGYDDFYVVDKKTSNNLKKPVDIYINGGTGKTFYHYTGSEVYGSDKREYRFADFNGDGKSDFICYAKWNDPTPGYDLYTVANDDCNLLTEITDGLGNTTKVEYKRLTDGTVHARGTQTGYPVVSISCPWSVVSRVSTPDGLGGLHTVDYKYTNLLLHKRGRGILGFEKVTATDNSTGAVTVSEYEIMTSEMVQALKSVKTSVKGRLLKETEYTNTLSYQQHILKKDVSFTCLPTRTAERVFEYNSGSATSETVTDTEYDKYGNVTRMTVASGGNTVTTVNTYVNDESKWLLGRLINAVVTKEGNGDNITLTSEFEYDNVSGLLVAEYFEPGNPKGYVKEYKYDKYGNVLEDVITPNDNAYSPRTVRTEYSGDGRFKVESVNSLGFASRSVVDPGLGVETSSTDINGLTTAYQHNAFGEITEVTTPLGSTKITAAWSSGHEYAPANSVYYIKTESTGTPVHWEFFDGLGRTLRKAFVGMNGKIVYTDVVYNSKGQVIKTSEPYFKGETVYWNLTEYDDAGRVVKETDAEGGVTSFGYNGLTATVTDPLNHTSSKTYDLNGNLVKSVDAKGGSITFKYDVNGKCVETIGPRTIISTEYDVLGNKTKLADPDLGTVEYEYNSFGEQVACTDSKGTTTFEYDRGGRLVGEYRPDFTYTHVYDTKWKGALSASSCSNGMSHEYSYDGYGRVTGEKEIINGETFITSNTYNAINKVDVMTYPSGLQIKNNYSADGYLLAVTTNTGDGKAYWTAEDVNARGQLTSELLGNGVTVSAEYYVDGAVKQIAAPNIIDKRYIYDSANNLIYRCDYRYMASERFSYDELNRLSRVVDSKRRVQNVEYDDAGNIVYKTGIGNFIYHEGTNRLKSVSEGYILPVWSDIGYTSFNKISSVTRDKSEPSIVAYDKLELQYGVDKSRKFQQTVRFQRRRFDGQPDKDHTTVLKTKYYVGNLYEKEIKGEQVRDINYIFANGRAVAVFEKTNADSCSTVYLHYDNLGSLMAVTNSAGQIAEELSYDAWGRRRDPVTFMYRVFSKDNTTPYDRGFTGHEHVDMFDMVNMDGRMYDPVIGRFLSPDPYVQMPDFTQSLNRYAYCINNPLSLTDPTGYSWIGDTFAALVGIAVGIETGGLASGIYGAIVGGALGGASASLMGSVLNGANLWQTAKGTFTGAFWGAAGGVMNFEIGNIENVFVRIAAHSVGEGAVEGIRGGHFDHGLLVGFVSSSGGTLINRYGTNLTYAEKVAVNAVLGGVVSELGGGKFASGAMTAAYTMMFNDMKHLKEEFRRKVIHQIKKLIISDGKLTLDEAGLWYKIGNGKMLTVDASKIDLNFLDVSTLKIGKKFSASTWKGNINQGLVYGSITCEYIGNSLIKILPDIYNFEPHLNTNGLTSVKIRNLATKIADVMHGEGMPFEIRFRGLNRVTDSLGDYIKRKIF